MSPWMSASTQEWTLCLSHTLCWVLRPPFHFDQQHWVRKPDFLWGMSQNQCQVFIVNLVFLFNNRHQTTCKNIATITKGFLKNKYSLQVCEGRKAIAPELQVGHRESFRRRSWRRGKSGEQCGLIATPGSSKLPAVHPGCGSPVSKMCDLEQFT